MEGLISVEQVNRYLSINKKTRTPMKWKRQENRAGNIKSYWRSAVAVKSDASGIETMFFICDYLPKFRLLEETYSFTLLFNNQRIYAVDIEFEQKTHSNKMAGAGRPFYKKKLRGPHEHLWSPEGYGYAEPLPDTLETTPQTVWHYFSNKTKIEIEGGFKLPYGSPDPNQTSLDFG